MKINSNTISLEKEEYKQIEELVTKIASENSIDNVESIDISLTKDSGIIQYKTAGWLEGIGTFLLNMADPKTNAWDTIYDSAVGFFGETGAGLGSYLGGKLGTFLNEKLKGSFVGHLPWETIGTLVGQTVGPKIAKGITEFMEGKKEEATGQQIGEAEEEPTEEPTEELAEGSSEEEPEAPSAPKKQLQIAAKEKLIREKIAEDMDIGSMFNLDDIMSVLEKYVPKDLLEKAKSALGSVDIMGEIGRLVTDIFPKLMGSAKG